MPDPTLSQAIREAYASAPADEVIYQTLEIGHPAFTQPIYVVRDHDDLTATLETGATVTFVRFNFDLLKPEVSASGVPQSQVEIDNTTREILENIQAANAGTDKITLTYREYLASDLSRPQNDPPIQMDFSNIKADVFRVRGTASFGDFMNKRFPPDDYTAERFPGLVAQ